MAVDALLDRIAGALPWRIIGWGAAAFLLLVPLAAMQFTGEVNWTLSDFIFAGIMFAIVGGILELAVWRSPKWSYRIAVGLAVASGFLHVWITGAVGIIGSEDNPGNLLYLAVVAIAIFGALVALGRPAGMAWAMLLTAVCEIAAPFIAYAYVADPRSSVLEPEVFAIGIVFTGMWIAASRLFRSAAEESAKA